MSEPRAAETPDPTPGSEETRRAVEALFTRSDGGFRFARWGRHLAPVVFGTDDAGIAVFEGALGAVAGLAGLELRDTDPELGANFLVFLVREWRELPSVPNLPKLIPDIEKLVTTLAAAGANQYRIFGFDEDGAIRICITLIRYDDEMQSVSAQTVAVGQSVMGLLLWSDHAFTGESPIAAVEGGRAVVKPWHANLIRAAYDPALPPAASDPALAFRLAARMALLDGR
jgi:hypothetical protein